MEYQITNTIVTHAIILHLPSNSPASRIYRTQRTCTHLGYPATHPRQPFCTSFHPPALGIFNLPRLGSFRAPPSPNHAQLPITYIPTQYVGNKVDSATQPCSWLASGLARLPLWRCGLRRTQELCGGGQGRSGQPIAPNKCVTYSQPNLSMPTSTTIRMHIDG